MGRTPNKTVLPALPEMNEMAVRADMQALNQVAMSKAQQDAAVRAVAHQVGYQLPADCTDADLIQRDIAANMRRSVEACLEVGRGLRVLKEACGHGNFVARLDVMGIETSVAQRFMQAAAKFSKAASTQLLKAAGNQTKLFEMLILDDAQLEELELTGQTGELKLDDIATMSVKELRTALREAKQDAEANGKLLADKNAKIDELAAERLKPASAPWDDKVKAVKAEVNGLFDVLDENAGRLYVCHDAILQGDFGTAGDEAQEQKVLRSLAVLYGDRLTRLVQQVAELQSHFDATLSGWAGELDGRALELPAGDGEEG